MGGKRHPVRLLVDVLPSDSLPSLIECCVTRGRYRVGYRQPQERWKFSGTRGEVAGVELRRQVFSVMMIGDKPCSRSNNDAPPGLCLGPSVSDSMAASSVAVDVRVSPGIVDDDLAVVVSSCQDDVSSSGQLCGEYHQMSLIDGVLDEWVGGRRVEVGVHAVVLYVVLNAPSPCTSSVRTSTICTICGVAIRVLLHAVERETSGGSVDRRNIPSIVASVRLRRTALNRMRSNFAKVCQRHSSRGRTASPRATERIWRVPTLIDVGDRSVLFLRANRHHNCEKE